MSNPKLPIRNKYTAKDQAKSDLATKFIGRGTPHSSTHAYALAWGDRANTSSYTEHDVVFVSAEGNRPGRISPDFPEIRLALNARAQIVTDDLRNRLRPYNVGERLVAEYLRTNGYHEALPGLWCPRPR